MKSWILILFECTATKFTCVKCGTCVVKAVVGIHGCWVKRIVFVGCVKSCTINNLRIECVKKFQPNLKHCISVFKEKNSVCLLDSHMALKLFSTNGKECYRNLKEDLIICMKLDLGGNSLNWCKNSATKAAKKQVDRINPCPWKTQQKRFDRSCFT